MKPFNCIFALLLLTAPAIGEIKTDIEYGKPDYESLKLDANIPDGNGPFPVVILVHGGGWSVGDKAGLFHIPTEALTKANFTWFSINYRMAPTYLWPDCFEDTKTAIRWVKTHAAEYKGDPRRIALVGYSAGGHLVCLAATLANEETRVQAVVGMSPPTDLELDLPRRGGLSTSLQHLLNRPQRGDGGMQEASARNVADQSRQAGVAAVPVGAGGQGQQRAVSGIVEFSGEARSQRGFMRFPDAQGRTAQYRHVEQVRPGFSARRSLIGLW